jgi:hypothetical protein
MGRILSENRMGVLRRTRAMSALAASFQEYVGWGSTQATPTCLAPGPGFSSCQAPSSTENRDSLFRLLEGKGREVRGSTRMCQGDDT